MVVYLYIPTSNHNVCVESNNGRIVVYLYIPTSNHNSQGLEVYGLGLYIFIFLHQTTTVVLQLWLHRLLYIFIFLHQTTTSTGNRRFNPMLYIFIFLHQTTTILCERIMNIGCISLYSYIKPQLDVYRHLDISVVYLYIPTSNHNTSLHTLNLNWLYIFIFLHQTTTCLPSCSCFCWLYIFIFLHQTTTQVRPSM